MYRILITFLFFTIFKGVQSKDYFNHLILKDSIPGIKGLPSFCKEIANEHLFFAPGEDYNLLVGRGSFDQNKKQGEWKLYTYDSILRAKGNYEHNLKSGNWQYLYNNGNIQIEGKFIKGEAEGLWTSYFSNGKIKWQGNYSHNLMQGKWKFYYNNDTLAGIVNYIDGSAETIGATGIPLNGRDGLFISYFSNGKVLGIQNWKNNHLIGLCKQYTDNGKSLDYIKKYNDDGKLDSVLTDYSNNKVASVTTYKNGVKEGVYKQYRDGNLSESGYYINDKEDSTWISYDYDGKPTEVYTYWQGMLEGSYKKYRIKEHGSHAILNDINDEWTQKESSYFISEEGFYKFGKLNGLQKFYEDAGILTESNLYKNDKLINHTEYNEKGQKIREEIMGIDGNQSRLLTFSNQGKALTDLKFNGYKKDGIEITTFDNDSIISDETKYTDGYKNYNKTYFDDGSPKLTEYYNSNDELDGIRTEYLEPGLLYKTEHYANGILNGEYISYTYDLEHYSPYDTTPVKLLLDEQGTYVNGLKEGVWRFSDKLVIFDITLPLDQTRNHYFVQKYKEDEMIGKATEYYQNGTKCGEGMLNEYQTKVGLWKSWYPNGKQHTEIEYPDELCNYPVNKYINIWDSEGKYIIKNGEGYISIRDTLGKIIKSGAIKNQVIDGIWKTYNSNGLLESCEFISNGNEMNALNYPNDNTETVELKYKKNMLLLEKTYNEIYKKYFDSLPWAKMDSNFSIYHFIPKTNTIDTTNSFDYSYSSWIDTGSVFLNSYHNSDKFDTEEYTEPLTVTESSIDENKNNITPEFRLDAYNFINYLKYLYKNDEVLIRIKIAVNNKKKTTGYMYFYVVVES